MNVNFFKNGITYLRHYSHLLIENGLLFGGKLVGRFIFPIMLIFGKEGDRTSNYPECELKSKSRIFFEQLWYILKTGEINKYYYGFGFDRKSKTDFKNYVPWLTFTNARNRKNQLASSPTYDHYNFVCMLRDKFVFEAFCSRVGINTPINIGMINDKSFFNLEDKIFVPLNEMIRLEINAFLKRNISCGGGMEGDVMPLRIEKGLIYINNSLMTIENFISLLGSDSWVVQEKITNQHETLNKLHPSSINTIRIVTVKHESSVDILTSFLRIGINGRPTDNFSSGGIVVGVENGKLAEWGEENLGIVTRIDKHPNSDIIFKDYEIPFWDEVQDIVKRAHRLFYGLHTVGWDVCITNDGIKLIEGNDNWDTAGVQYSGEGRKVYLKYFKN